MGAGDDNGDSDKRMTLWEHLEELRTRLIRSLLGLVGAMVVTTIFGKQILAFLKYPYDRVVEDLKDSYPNLRVNLSTLSVLSPMEIYFRVALYGGLVLAAPWILYQTWLFIAAGLYPKERRYVKLTVPFSTLLFFCGAMFFVFVAAVPAMRFLIWFGVWLGLDPIITLDSHISFMTSMMLIFGITFQTPLAVLILAKVGLVSVKTLNHYRKHVIVGILIVAAVATPSPSPLDQIVLGVPMWMLYELGVLLAYIATRKKGGPPQEA